MESQPTSNFLNWVEIKNFKSIKDLRLDCKRVNIFIGKPNVGKSNILEGLGLLGAEYSTDQFLKGSVRYKELKHLFYDGKVDGQIEITANSIRASVFPSSYYPDNQTGFIYILFNTDLYASYLKRDLVWQAEEAAILNLSIDKRGKISNISNKEKLPNDKDRSSSSFVKKYDFLNLNEFDSLFSNFLLPPNGNNLFTIVRERENLGEIIADLFKEQQLDLVLSANEQIFVLQRRKGALIWQYPYFSIADTFRRFIFYITAIASNDNSVIIFEEPEVHSFPPYTQELAYRMIYDEKNQYFISTHSPYMLHPFIEKMDYKDLNIFITYYEDYQTKVRALTEEELTDILDYSTNVFFNLRKFEPNA